MGQSSRASEKTSSSSLVKLGESIEELFQLGFVSFEARKTRESTNLYEFKIKQSLASSLTLIVMYSSVNYNDLF